MRGHLRVAGSGEGKVARQGHHQQYETRRDARGDVQSEVELLLVNRVLLVEDGFQCEDSQNDHSHVGHHQAHGGSAELVVERQVVEQEAVESHQVFAPGHQDGEDGGEENPPAFGPFHHKHAQDEKEDDDGTEIDRTGGEGLVAPVERGLLLAEVLVEFGIFAYILAGSAAVRAGHEERVGFAFAVAPAESVVLVQTVGSGNRLRLAVLIQVFGGHSYL